MLTPDAVDRIAVLARLQLTDDERRLLAGQLAAILDYVDQLAAADPGGEGDAEGDGLPAGDRDAAPDPDGPGPDRLTLRPDVPGPSLPRDVALANAPDAVDGYLRVPQVLGGEAP